MTLHNEKKGDVKFLEQGTLDEEEALWALLGISLWNLVDEQMGIQVGLVML